MNKQLASQLAGVMTIALLVGTSAFAEDRHRDETNRGGEHRETHQRDANQNSGQSHVDSYRNRATNETRTYDRRGETRGNNNSTYNNNNFDHSRTNRENRTYTQNDRNYGQSNAWRGSNDHRYDNRSNDRYRGNNNRGYEHRGNPYYAHGRISRIDRWNGGFRIYIGGAPYPFFVPEARFRLGGWRVGLDINLGGYYNPLGYYDYYDDAYYGGGAAVSAGALRGVVETVDYRRGSFVIRDDASGGYITVLMRCGDRTFDAIRPGVYVNVAGDWSRAGLFNAYRADLIDDGQYYRR
jgi:hypothetical protein